MTTESTKAGQQFVLPGAETRRDFVRREAAKPLRPLYPQQPCDVGLFSDDARQSDLVELAQTKT